MVITGAGGVGKTTISAALAIRGARTGLRTLVLTVDPAQRLSDALGLEQLGTEPTPNTSQPNLWAAMLDSSASWTRIVTRHAPPDVAERLVSNEFFLAIAERFPASQSYAAAEEMANYLDAQIWDLVVIDTPPSVGGIDFFTAPADIQDLVGGRLIRWLTGARLPGRRTVYSLAGRPALRIADGVLGTDLLQRIAEFLLDLRTTYDGLTARAAEIERHFSDATVIVVTTADPGPIREAVRFFRELPEVAATPRLVVFNRSLPENWYLAAPDETDLGPQARLLDENLARWAAESHRQTEARHEFASRYQTEMANVPWLERAPTDLEALASLVGPDLADLLPEPG